MFIHRRLFILSSQCDQHLHNQLLHFQLTLNKNTIYFGFLGENTINHNETDLIMKYFYVYHWIVCK